MGEMKPELEHDALCNLVAPLPDPIGMTRDDKCTCGAERRDSVDPLDALLAALDDWKGREFYGDDPENTMTAMSSAARASLAALRASNAAGWRGLANIYHMLTGTDCDEKLALGLATSEVDKLRRSNTAQRRALEKLLEIIKAADAGNAEAFNWENVGNIARAALQGGSQDG